MTFDVWWVHRTNTADTRSVAYDAWCAAEEAIRADLYAKVKALPVAYTMLGETKLDDFNMVFVRDVLALFEKVSDDQ